MSRPTSTEKELHQIPARAAIDPTAHAAPHPMLNAATSALGRAMIQRKLQRRAVERAARSVDEGSIHDAAARGTSGAATALPHLDAIQRSFGKHDVSGVSAHLGATATEASRAIGAEAYATGNDVAFAGTPSLHTAAHEAAHVVQQRAGVQLKGGVGAEGDAYERHADAVADGVVRGESVESLLGSMAVGAPSATATVQRKPIRPNWGSNNPEKFRAIVGDVTDTDDLSPEKLGELIQFLEGDMQGRNLLVLPQLKRDLEERKKLGGSKRPPPKSTAKSSIIKESSINVDTNRWREKELPGGIDREKRTNNETEEPEGHTSTSSEPLKEGTLRVHGLPAIYEPVDHHAVFKNPPESIPVTFNNRTVKVWPRQSYLNTEMSTLYKDDPSKIAGTEAILAPWHAKGDDAFVLNDGHHRFVWSAYHGRDVPVTEATLPGSGGKWAEMIYQPDPDSIKLNPINDVNKIKEEFFLAYISPESAYTQHRKSTLEKFIKAMCKIKKLEFNEENGKLLEEHILMRQGQNPNSSFYEVVRFIAGQCSDKEVGDGYLNYLTTEIQFSGKAPPIIFGSNLETTGHFDTSHNVLTIDIEKVTAPEAQLDTISFEAQNALRKKAIYQASKSELNVGENVAEIECENDRAYVFEALLSTYHVDNLNALLDALKVERELREKATYSTDEKFSVPMPPRSWGSQAQRQALWWWKTDQWPKRQVVRQWIKEKHGEGVKSTKELYKKDPSKNVKVGML